MVPQIYRIREMSARELTASGGRYEVGDVRVIVTPACDEELNSGGLEEAELAPNGATGTEIIYILSGGINGEYSRHDVKGDRPFRRELVLRRTVRTP